MKEIIKDRQNTAEYGIKTTEVPAFLTLAFLGIQSLIGCDNQVHQNKPEQMSRNVLFAGEIVNQSGKKEHALLYIATMRDQSGIVKKVEVLEIRPSGNRFLHPHLEFVDADTSGTLGDDKGDYCVERKVLQRNFLGGVTEKETITYSRDAVGRVNVKGGHVTKSVFSSTDTNPVAQQVVKEGQNKLQAATALFREYKNRIGAELTSRMKQK